MSELEVDKHLKELTPAVWHVFLPLGYADEEVKGFLQNQKDSQPTPADVCCIETDVGSVFARIKRDTIWDISYLIPDRWDKRYEILEKALKEIVSEAHQANVEEIFIRIEENPPSHNAYFAGMLPHLGFTLTPRAALAAPLETIDQLSPPELPDKIEEVAVQSSDLNEIVEWYGDALLSHRTRPISDGERRRGNKGTLRSFNRYLEGKNSQAWVVLADGNNHVAVAIGTCVENGNLTLSQIGVASTHRGLGLGRYIVIRCMQKLLDQYGDRGKQFWVRTGRTWNPAYGLYQKLGFRTREFYTYAQYFCADRT